MTKEEFEIKYIERSNITKKSYDDNFVTLPCKCGDEGCCGFACVSNNKLSIKSHNDLFL